MPKSFAYGLGKDSENILLILRKEIEQGVFPVQARFPTEAILCKRFSTSRSTIRRALERLCADHYLESKQGSGYYVLQRQREVERNRVIGVMFRFDSSSLLATQEQLLKKRYLLCTYTREEFGWSPENERLFLERIRALRATGLLAWLTPTSPHNDDLLKAMHREGIRIIHIEPYSYLPPEQNYLLPDYYQAGVMVATRFLLKGYKYFHYAGTNGDWPGANLFKNGFLETLATHTKNFDGSAAYFEFPTDLPSSPSSLKKFDDFLNSISPGVAIACRSADFAGEIYGHLIKRGFRYPDDFDVAAVTYLGWLTDQRPFLTVEFDRINTLSRAISLLTDDTEERIMEHIKPHFCEPTQTIQSFS